MIDEWSGLAELLANMIEKYASEWNFDELPAPETENKSVYSGNITQSGLDKELAA